MVKYLANRNKAVKRKDMDQLQGSSENHRTHRKQKSTSILEKKEREGIVIWRRPLKTSDYFIRELGLNMYSVYLKLLNYKLSVILSFFTVFSIYIFLHIDGPHKPIMEYIQRKILFCLYWLGLGILSSIGLGTGLHTFVLYLGPHIASVTLAAYECGSLNFPEPPYPNEIICPHVIDTRWTTSLWNIMRKVHLEAMMWGAGTALGELPPYFMARAARLSGKDEEDEDLEELKKLKKIQKGSLSFMDGAKLMMQQLVEKVGFFGILACASVPNPLFDLAGITCGHFLVPFWTFFGAVLIGKAVIKMTLQVFFVIVTFNEVLIEKVMTFLETIPVVGLILQKLLNDVLQKQKERLHRDSEFKEVGTNLIGKVFDVFVLVMVLYFIISIINSLAQNYHKRLCKRSESEKSA
ncbi:vacuole membrane protein 1-like isoform X2 [Lycorma delicatula]|uniref:vacuole membrane protein 1-like isoform X2 n=1 Tax=Lycorma delicatula TaxID=130591 RepID=UPI003F50FC3F